MSIVNLLIMAYRYQLVLQSKDGETDYNTSANLKTKPSIKKAEKIFNGQIKPGMRLTLDTKTWDEENNEAYELADRQTLKEY